MRFKGLALVGVVLGSAACVTTETRTFNANPSGTCQARILHVPPTAGQYEEIGELHLTAGALAPLENVREDLRQKACAAGADAVYISNPGYPACSFNFFIPSYMTGVLLKTKESPPTATP